MDDIHPITGKLWVVLPVISKQTTDICIDSIKREGSAGDMRHEDILLVDNSREGWAAKRYGLRIHRDSDGHNLGVARSWNVGARLLLETGRDYLVLMSASMQFGPTMHTTLTKQLGTFWGSPIIEADGHSWHLIAIHRTVFEQVGLFDENFYPAYFEAIDWAYRATLLGIVGWPRYWINALSQGTALHLDQVSCPAGPLLDYYREKWGGDKGFEQYEKPFNGDDMTYFPARTIPELAERYGLENWW